MPAIFAVAGWKGFDTNSALTAVTAAAFRSHGYEFVIRYVPRITQHANDLTTAEVAAIRASGLALGVVQHVESETSWVPDAARGVQYGTMAAWQCASLSIAKGTTVWLDLEGVAVKTPSGNVIAYCQNWYRAVLASGFNPGLYVGWHCGLGPSDLYRKLSFRHYWGSYNLNADEEPAVRGLQMRQHAAKSSDTPAGIGFPIDTNLVMTDALGGLPTFDGTQQAVVA